MTTQAKLLTFLTARFALIWTTIGLALMLIAEIIFPGFIGRIVPLSAAIIAVALLLAITTATNPHYKTTTQKPKKQSSLLIVISLITITPLLLLTLHKFSLPEITIITLITLTIFWYFLKNKFCAK